MMDDNSYDADEAQIYAAVHGVTPSGAAPDELGTYLHSMRAELCEPPDPQARWNHLAAMRREKTPAPKRQKVRGLVAIVAATAGLVTVTTGLAAADRLPQAAQDQVAKLAEYVGVDLPGNDRGPAASPPKPESSSDRPTRGTSPARRAARSGSDSSGATADPATAPGASGSAPGRSDADPPAATTSPGNSGNAPGQTGTTPGTAVTPPGQSGSAPGQSGSAPGQGGSSPGKSGNAPGQTGETPGKSGLAPGQTSSPGKSESTPAATARGKHSPIVPEDSAAN